MELRIRNVEDETHRALKVLAAEQGVSLNDLITEIITIGVKSIKRDKKKKSGSDM